MFFFGLVCFLLTYSPGMDRTRFFTPCPLANSRPFGILSRATVFRCGPCVFLACSLCVPCVFLANSHPFGILSRATVLRCVCAGCMMRYRYPSIFFFAIFFIMWYQCPCIFTISPSLYVGIFLFFSFLSFFMMSVSVYIYSIPIPQQVSTKLAIFIFYFFYFNCT